MLLQESCLYKKMITTMIPASSKACSLPPSLLPGHRTCRGAFVATIFVVKLGQYSSPVVKSSSYIPFQSSPVH